MGQEGGRDPAFAPDSAGELCRLTATAAVAALRRGEISPLELIDAAEARIAATDPTLNALPTLCLDRARDRARRLMAEGPAGGGVNDPVPPGWLAGLPIAVKDLVPVAGVRCTWGSPIFADHVPERSDILVERLEARGALVAAKSNTPEFGAGASTFNAVFGKTRNPWNPARSVAGSSGGAAACLAANQLWLATGSDLGGSLRTPASFCGVIGFRPSPGRVARGPETRPFDTLSVEGPMARTVEDTALFLDAMAGAHPEDPLALDAPALPYVDQLRRFRMGGPADGIAAVRALVSGDPSGAARLPRPPRAAWSPDLGGITPVDPEVAALCAAAAERLAAQGFELVELAQVPAGQRPDFAEAPETFQTLRAAGYAAGKAELLASHRDQLKPEVIWNIEKGMALTADSIGAALRAQGRLCARIGRFFESHDLLLCPAAIVPPFDVDIRWLEACQGERFETYIDWLRLATAITLTGCPAASIPAGLTADGLPVGLQLVGPPRMEGVVLGAGLLGADLAETA